VDINETISLLDEVHEDLKFIAISNVRIKIMISLNFGPKNLKMLRNETNMNSSTISHAINQMEKRNLINPRTEFYSLSSPGKIMALKLINTIMVFSALKNHQKFWMEHDICRIPEQFLRCMGMLNESSVIESTNSNLTKPLNTYLELLSQERTIKCVSPIFFSHHIESVTKILKEGGKVDIILTREVMESLLENTGEEKLESCLKSSRLNLWLCDDDLGVAITNTPRFFVLGLFSVDGTYDFSSVLLSHNSDAIRWGYELFEYYKKRSKKVDIKKLTFI